MELLVRSAALPTHPSLQWEGWFPKGERGEGVGRMLGMLCPTPRPRLNQNQPLPLHRTVVGSGDLSCRMICELALLPYWTKSSLEGLEFLSTSQGLGRGCHQSPPQPLLGWPGGFWPAAVNENHALSGDLEGLSHRSEREAAGFWYMDSQPLESSQEHPAPPRYLPLSLTHSY